MTDIRRNRLICDNPTAALCIKPLAYGQHWFPLGNLELRTAWQRRSRPRSPQPWWPAETASAGHLKSVIPVRWRAIGCRRFPSDRAAAPGPRAARWRPSQGQCAPSASIPIASITAFHSRACSASSAAKSCCRSNPCFHADGFEVGADLRGAQPFVDGLVELLDDRPPAFPPARAARTGLPTGNP